MTLRNGVVVHYLDNRILKGTTQDFSPDRPAFHVIPQEGGQGISVQRHDLKAVFFVKTLDGDPFRADLKGFIAGPPKNAHGIKVAVRFSDRELLCGHSLGYSPQRLGFFVVPSDRGSNNKRVFVVMTPGVEVAQGRAAEEMAQKALDSRAA